MQYNVIFKNVHVQNFEKICHIAMKMSIIVNDQSIHSISNILYENHYRD